MPTTTSLSYSPALQPGIEEIAGKALALTDTTAPIYGGERVAGFTDLQKQAQQEAANLGPSQQIGTATQMAGLAGLRAGNISYDPGSYGNYYSSPAGYQNGQFSAGYNAPGAYQSGQFGYNQVNAPSNLQYFQSQGPQNVYSQSFLQPGTTDAYMSPYMQAVVDATKRESIRDTDIQRTRDDALASRMGAYGGSRHGIVDAERERNLGTRLSDIQSQGLQSAFGNAQQQFNAEQQARLQAQMANQGAGLQTNLANLNAALGVQQLGSGQSMQAALANQQAGMTAQQLAEQSRQFGYGNQMTAAQLAAQYGLTAQQLAEQSRQFGYGNQMTAAQLAAQYGLQGDQLSEQSRQFGANLGLQGLQTQLNASSQLGQLGQLEFGQQKDIINAMNTAGAQQQALQQQQYDTDYQSWLRQQQYPMQMLGMASDIYRGLPTTSQTQTTFTSPASPLTQAAGTALTGYNLFSGKAGGGEIKDPQKRTSGLADLLLHSMR